MPDPVLQTHDLSKSYGPDRGIMNVSLRVEAAEIFGFLGPNGAGKTTAIRVLLDLIRPTTGHAEVFGLETVANSVEIRQRTGYLPGEMSLYENMTGLELLQYFASLRESVDWSLVDQMAQRLSCDLSRRIGALSQGNKRKVGLIQAFMHRPELLILDEPTAGLDPLIQHEFLSLISEASQSGQTVFLSSHNLTEVERICDRVGMIRGGRLIAVEHIDDLKKRAVRKLEIQFAGPVPTEPFQNLTGIHDLMIEGDRLTCTLSGSADAIVKQASSYEVVDLVSQQPSLEEIFMALYSDAEVPNRA
ncbi:MAG: ABC transporter ATP-binding protein [Sphaerobacteraceae bacterium]|nr:MAG: ABC transporter ATP-binding protein [Sphaerobacteraceae bacterium]